MKKIMIVCLFSLMANLNAHPVDQSKGSFEDKFRQLDEIFPDPNQYRAATGEPTNKYWQQQADYKIDIELFEDERSLKGSETIKYTNNSPLDLKYIWIQLDQNIFKQDSIDFQTRTISSNDKINFSTLRNTNFMDDFIGGIQNLNIKVNGSQVNTKIVGTMVRVDLNQKEKLDQKKIDNYKNLVFERSRGKPIAYLVEKKYFWKYEFKVNKNVLIPRPDTEIIIEQVLELTKNKSKLKVLDIGIGSGCILLSILKEKNDFYGIGVDVSKKCLNISKINALRLKVFNRLKLFKSDIDNFNYGKYDLIISNPPYIALNELPELDKEVILYDPLNALTDYDNGLTFYQYFYNFGIKNLNNRGYMLFEFGGKEQVDSLRKIFKNKIFNCKFFDDLNNDPRFILIQKK